MRLLFHSGVSRALKRPLLSDDTDTQSGRWTRGSSWGVRATGSEPCLAGSPLLMMRLGQEAEAPRETGMRTQPWVTAHTTTEMVATHLFLISFEFILLLPTCTFRASERVNLQRVLQQVLESSHDTCRHTWEGKRPAFIFIVHWRNQQDISSDASD